MKENKEGRFVEYFGSWDLFNGKGRLKKKDI